MNFKDRTVSKIMHHRIKARSIYIAMYYSETYGLCAMLYIHMRLHDHGVARVGKENKRIFLFRRLFFEV